MPIYDCGDPECGECRREFGPDRSKAIAQYEWRAKHYAEVAGLRKHTHKAGTLAGKHIDTCAICGKDIRNEIHSRQ